MTPRLGSPHQVGELLYARHGSGVRLGDLRGNHVGFTPTVVVATLEDGRIHLDWEDIVDIDLDLLAPGREPVEPIGGRGVIRAALDAVCRYICPRPRWATVTLLLEADALRLPLAHPGGRGYRARDVRAIQTYLRLCLRSDRARASLVDSAGAIALVRIIARHAPDPRHSAGY